MKILLKLIFTLFVAIIILSPKIIFAHQPRIVESNSTSVVDPEISKAYYGNLSGESHIYTIDSDEEFNLYVGILVPDAKNPKRDVTAEIYSGKELIKTIGGSDAEWKTFFEPFGQSTYWDGGEYKVRAQAGQYTIVVSSKNNDSKYSLAIGEIEAFDGKEGVNALNLIPGLKRDFFGESPIGFTMSPFGWGLILVMYLLAFIFGFIYRAMLKKFAKTNNRKVHKNIGRPDRLIRFAIAAALLVLAITTTWNPLLIFFSGFALFEAIFSWCGFYAALGKNTCPIRN